MLLIAIFYLIYFLRQEKQKKNKQKGLHQTKKVSPSKGNHQQMKRKSARWENIFSNDILDKGLISKIFKELT